MPKYTLGEGGGFTNIPEGSILQAEIIAVEEKVMPFTDDEGNEIRKIEFKFALKEDEYRGRQIWGQTSTNFTPNPGCKLRAWTLEIMGIDTLPPGFVLDTDTLVGLPCRVQIAHRIQKKAEGDITRDFVSDVIRAKNREGVSAGEIF